MRRGKVLSILTVLLVFAGIACVTRDVSTIFSQIGAQYTTFIGAALLLLGATAGFLTITIFRKDCRRLTAIIQNVQDLGARHWHRLVASHVWSLWTRYVCTAFYSHPWAWQEIGFGGPAYPRGYKNIGVDRREPYEVRDAHPAVDPTRGAVPTTGAEG